MNLVDLIRGLTMASLFGLLLTVGLRLTLGEVLAALRRCRLALVLAVNFLAIPALVVGVAKAFQLDTGLAVGMILLGAAPFAPVVPIFAKMARADLALAAGLTSVVPLLSAFITPFACALALRAMPDAGEVRFAPVQMLVTLTCTITFPLCLGVGCHHWLPALSRRLLRTMEILSEATGLLSLCVVVGSEIQTILGLGWVALLAMVLSSEVSFLVGYTIGGPERGARRVVALGTSNRNIALALLIAIQSFPETSVVPGVVANGLLLILLGLLHVAFWRFVRDRNRG